MFPWRKVCAALPYEHPWTCTEALKDSLWKTVDIFSQSRCRNSLIMKSKMALLSNHLSDFVSTAPGRIPSVLKVAQCNHSRSYQFAVLGVLPGKQLITPWRHSVLQGCILQAGRGESQEISTVIWVLSFTPQCQQQPLSIGQTFSVGCFWSHQKQREFFPICNSK